MREFLASEETPEMLAKASYTFRARGALRITSLVWWLRWMDAVKLLIASPYLCALFPKGLYGDIPCSATVCVALRNQTSPYARQNNRVRLLWALSIEHVSCD